MLSHLAADERAASLAATLGNAGDDLGHRLGLQLAHGNVVKEEQGLSAGCQHVVHAHSHQVDAHGVVFVADLSQAQLGANAVGAGHGNGVFHILSGSQAEQTAESADIANDLRAIGAVHGVLNGVYRTSALLDVYARLGIGNGVVGDPAWHLRSVLGLGGADLNSIGHGFS